MAPSPAGDFILVPSGTIHAIGAGISLLEFQQNADVTYRLYDYGRPRELHLDDGVAVAAAKPFDDGLVQHLSADEQRTLVDGPHFTLVLTSEDALQGRQRWVMPLDGEVHSGLSWITILRKRENFRDAFPGFDIDRVAAMGDDDIERLLQDAGIIRHRGKIVSTINNARRALEISRSSARSPPISGASSPARASGPRSRLATICEPTRPRRRSRLSRT